MGRYTYQERYRFGLGDEMMILEEKRAAELKHAQIKAEDFFREGESRGLAEVRRVRTVKPACEKLCIVSRARETGISDI
jgi:hypothetical protein